MEDKSKPKSDKQFLAHLKKLKETKKISKGSNKFSKKIKNRKQSVILSDELLEVINDLNNKPETTYPHMEYCKDGDVLSIDLEDFLLTEYYADWVGSYKEKGGQAHSISVLKQQKTNKVIGFEIWGLLSFLKENNVSFEQKYGKKSST